MSRQIFSFFLAPDEMWPPLPMKLGVWVGQCGGFEEHCCIARIGDVHGSMHPRRHLQWDSSVRIDTLAHLHSVGVLGDLRECRGLGRSLLHPNTTPSSNPPPYASFHPTTHKCPQCTDQSVGSTYILRSARGIIFDPICFNSLKSRWLLTLAWALPEQLIKLHTAKFGKANIL